MQRGIDYIGVGVDAVIVDDAGRLFFARRGPQAKNERGLWEFPGGAVEFGERLADALRREIREEYDVEITVGPLLDVADHTLVCRPRASTGFRRATSVGLSAVRPASVSPTIAARSPGSRRTTCPRNSPRSRE